MTTKRKAQTQCSSLESVNNTFGFCIKLHEDVLASLKLEKPQGSHREVISNVVSRICKPMNDFHFGDDFQSLFFFLSISLRTNQSSLSVRQPNSTSLKPNHFSESSNSAEKRIISSWCAQIRCNKDCGPNLGI